MLTHFNSKNTTVQVGSAYITGLAEEFWSFTKREANAEDSVGSQGDVVRS